VRASHAHVVHVRACESVLVWICVCGEGGVGVLTCASPERAGMGVSIYQSLRSLYIYIYVYI